jgi:glycosyltransferase involved in cell wall biosynthesis
MVEYMQGISVVIPCYNREAFLKEAIESVLAQQYHGPIEIIVADDGSTDRSVEIATSFGSPVIVVKKPSDCKSQGAGMTRNRAIAASIYPFIAFLDSDDLFLPGHLQRLAEVLESDSNVGLVFDEAKTMVNGKLIDFPYPEWFKCSPDACAMLLEPLPQTNAMMINRRVLDQIVGPFDPDLMYSEDIDFRLRVAELFPVVFVKGYGSVIRNHDNRSIFNERGDVLFYNDMLMINKATARYSYPKDLVSMKKSKMYYHLSVSKYKNKKYILSLICLFSALMTSPVLFLNKFIEKVKS